MELTELNFDNLCLSGGAVGADLQWGMCAGKLGHSVIHWSFAGHATQAPAQEVVVLSTEQLVVADPFLVTASTSLKRHVSRKPHIANLLRRNYYQVAWTDSLYAVSSFDKNGSVMGGTAWAVQLMIDRQAGKPCWVYDQTTEMWFNWNYDKCEWETGTPSTPSGIWAGVGSRDLSLSGKNAIRALMNYSV